ncbi:MAG: hypothetical protein ACI9SY_000489, partial [Candidatus Paceibacteria bacterium]
MNRIQEKFSHPLSSLFHLLFKDRGLQAILLVGGIGI